MTRSGEDYVRGLRDGRTVLFDGVEELSLAAQAKLLRVLEGRSFERLGGTATLPFTARPVAVSGTDLEERVRGGRCSC